MQDMKILRLVGSRYAKMNNIVFAVAMGNSRRCAQSLRRQYTETD